jgi:iron uptake system component EfeO
MTTNTMRLLILSALVAGASACTQNHASSSAGAVQVASSTDACTLSATSAPSGNVVFEVTNKGSEVTEFYLLGADGLRIVGEVENIGPGLTRNLVVRADAGDYVTACKPGMTGDGIRAPFTVISSGSTAPVDQDRAALLEDATTQYETYVRGQTEQLVAATMLFAELIKSGDREGARRLYPQARTNWERIEPVAESFGDLDPKLDLREADLEEGREWTGWHRLEKYLWPLSGSTETDIVGVGELDTLVDRLVADTTVLSDRVATLSLDATSIGNGAKELLDEVATGKVTGEEEIWSHTDLWDFQANIDGARVAFESLRPVVETSDKQLATTLEERFAAVQRLLDAHRRGDGFVLYDELSVADVKELADAVSALGEPLAELTSAVVL